MMYRKILVTLDTSASDQVILDHIRPLARLMGSRIVLLHVADGWAARLYGRDAVSREITEDRAYLARVEAQLAEEGFAVESDLAFGDPATQIVGWVETKGCDLIAMSTHGHRLLGDLLLGTTATRVRHMVYVPVLMLRAKKV
jgi:nucleotide-binding universal stress UspA family protein